MLCQRENCGNWVSGRSLLQNLLVGDAAGRSSILGIANHTRGVRTKCALARTAHDHRRSYRCISRHDRCSGAPSKTKTVAGLLSGCDDSVKNSSPRIVVRLPGCWWSQVCQRAGKASVRIRLKISVFSRSNCAHCRHSGSFVRRHPGAQQVRNCNCRDDQNNRDYDQQFN